MASKSQRTPKVCDARDFRSFYAETKNIYGPNRSSTGTLKSVDNTNNLTDSQNILQRWKEHLSTLLNRNSNAAKNFPWNMPQHLLQPSMSDSLIRPKLSEAISKMKFRKSPGTDNIPLELIQHGGLPLKTRLFTFFLQMWENQRVSADLKNAVIITIFKKGDRSICGNYRGISLLSNAGKIFARILPNRLLIISKKILPESQWSFRASRGTIGMILWQDSCMKRVENNRNIFSSCFMTWKRPLTPCPDLPCGWLWNALAAMIGL